MKKYQIIIPCIAILFASCSPTYYVPTKQNVMVFEESKDASVAITASWFNMQMGIEGGYAFTEHLGAYSSIYRFDASQYGDYNKLIKDYLWDNELVIFDKTKTGIYTGINLGYGFAGFNVGNPYYDIHLNRISALPSVGYDFCREFSAALSTRFSYLHYNVSMQNSEGFTAYDRDMFNQYFNTGDLMNPNHFLIEPALTLTFKTEFVKLNLQYCCILNPGNKSTFYSRDNLSASWIFDIGKMFIKPYEKNGKLRWKF